jgi:hypothetical protein
LSCRARTAVGLTTYRYLFAGNFSNITPRYWLGAMHSCKRMPLCYLTVWMLTTLRAAELPLVFGTHFEFNGNSTELEYETSYAMEGTCLPSSRPMSRIHADRLHTADFWVSFLTNSSTAPTDSQGLVWPKYNASGAEMMFFGNATGGPAQLVPGNYYDAVYQCPNTAAPVVISPPTM